MSRLDQLKTFLAEDPADAFTRFALAMEYVKLGDPAAAEREFEELVRRHPAYVGTYYHFGKLRESQGRPDAAAALYEQGIAAARAADDAKNLAELEEALALLRGQDPEDALFDEWE